MKTIILSPFYPISDKLDVSHRAGWPRYWGEELTEQGADVTILTTKTLGQLANVTRDDDLMIYHGMEFQGMLNLQSGLTDDIVKRAELFASAARRCNSIISMDLPMPDYGKLLADRGLDPELAGKLTNLKRRSSRAETPHLGSDTRRVVMGDSHSLSLYRPGTVVARFDAKTLHGALNQVLLTMLDGWLFESNIELRKPELLTAYFGNIDLRHHLPRQPDPSQAIKELVAEYGRQLDAVRKVHKFKAIEVAMPLPIEDESRQIPKTMWYQGKAFHGSWSERHQLRLELRTQLRKMARKHGFEIYEHPRHWTQKDGKLSFDVMEKPRSVHIRPAEYRLVQDGQAWRV